MSVFTINNSSSTDEIIDFYDLYSESYSKLCIHNGKQIIDLSEYLSNTSNETKFIEDVKFVVEGLGLIIHYTHNDDVIGNKKQLIIHKTWHHNTPLFSNIRGSTPLIECEEGVIGVVHFSYEGGPRNYFHMLVLLEKNTLMPLKYSEFFVFNNMSVEFCIGFTIRDNKYLFLISNFDRDPELVIVDRSEIPLLFDFYY
jgi:hypothetical protein